MRPESDMGRPQSSERDEPSTQSPSTRHGRYFANLSVAAIVVAVCLPLLQYTPLLRSASAPSLGVDGGVIRKDTTLILEPEPAFLHRRTDSPTDVCDRWSHQSAVINGTVYIYGGQATMEAGQTENKWNNYFLSMDLTSSWQISTPSFTGLQEPSGPPNVSNGYLWNSHESLYLYGGEFSDSPVAYPTAFSLWEYNVPSSEWIEHSNVTTSAGTNSDTGGQSVQRAAEGAGASVAGLGRGWYFGGHQDGYTTEGWSQSTPRIYLKSLLEFTFPGYENSQVDALSDSQTAGSDGVWRNITEGGTQDSAGFTERADGLLLYIPGFGDQGILVGLAGGTSDTFTQMNVIDVYDIATSTWYKQSTSGSTPKFRVNPCAVVASAADGSSYQLYMFGGQNLQPAKNQTQYNDMWILTIPSFTWIEVDQSSQSVPYGRSGHSCHIWDSQMIVVGGYTGELLSCDSPGIYVFNASSLEWGNQFTALSAASDSQSSDSSSSGSSGSSAASASGSADAASSKSTGSGSDSTSSTFVSNSKTNPFNQQPAQLANGTSIGGLEGSYGYKVPEVVISIIGGSPEGGATVTTPVLTATSGPLATGSAIIYSTPTSGGSTATSTSNSGGSGNGNSNGNDGPNVAAIVAGVVAGVLFLIVCYLGFCAWLYRKRLQLYQRHVEMSQRAALNEKRPTIPGLFPPSEGTTSKGSSDPRRFMSSSEENSGIGNYGRPGFMNGSTSGSGSGMQNSLLRRGSDDSGAPESLLAGEEPSFWGVLVAPRRSLRVVNRD